MYNCNLVYCNAVSDLSVSVFPGEWQWESIDGSVCVPLPPPSVPSFTNQYDLCVTGEGLARLSSDLQLLHALLPHVQVFARVSPKQKVWFGFLPLTSRPEQTGVVLYLLCFGWLFVLIHISFGCFRSL